MIPPTTDNRTPSQIEASTTTMVAMMPSAGGSISPWYQTFITSTSLSGVSQVSTSRAFCTTTLGVTVMMGIPEKMGRGTSKVACCAYAVGNPKMSRARINICAVFRALKQFELFIGMNDCRGRTGNSGHRDPMAFNAFAILQGSRSAPLCEKIDSLPISARPSGFRNV